MQEQDTIWLRPAVEIRACCQVPVVHLLILHYICQMEATVEMLAYTTYSDVEGFTKNAFGDFMNAARGVNGNISYDADNIKEKKDYMSMVKELMQLQYDSNNLPGYLSYKELYDYMNDKING